MRYELTDEEWTAIKPMPPAVQTIDTPLSAAVARGADLICLAPGSSVPVLLGDWLEQGQHVTSIVASNKGVLLHGAVSRPRCEFDDAVIARADRVIATLKEQAIMDEQADLFEPATISALTRSPRRRG